MSQSSEVDLLLHLQTHNFCVFHSSNLKDGVSRQSSNGLKIIDRMNSAAFLLPETWRSSQERKFRNLI